VIEARTAASVWKAEDSHEGTKITKNGNTKSDQADRQNVTMKFQISSKPRSRSFVSFAASWLSFDPRFFDLASDVIQ